MGETYICYLHIDQSGSKYWIFNYTRPFWGKRNDLYLGTYPEVSLDEACTIRDEYKKLIKQGIDLVMEWIETKSQEQKEAENNFRVIAELWLHKCEKKGVNLCNGFSFEKIKKHSGVFNI